MNRRILQLLANLSQENLDLLLSPRLGLTKVSQKPHGPSFQGRIPVRILEVTSLLEELILGPGTEGDLVLFLVDVDEAGLLDCVAHGFVGSEGSAGALGAADEEATPAVELVFGFQGAVVAVDSDVEFHLFDPAAGLEGAGNN